MAADSKRSAMLRTYGDVMSFLLRAYEMNEAIAECYNGVFSFRQSFTMTEETHSQMLRDNSLRCGAVFFNRILKSIFIDGLLSEPRAQTCQFRSFNLRSDHHNVVRQVQALGCSV